MEHYRDDGDYDRAVAATSGVPCVAVKASGGNILLKKLGVDSTGIVVQDAFEIPDSPVYILFPSPSPRMRRHFRPIGGSG